MNYDISFELKPCPNPDCKWPEPDLVEDNSFGLSSGFVQCPKCLMRGPEFSIGTNSVLHAKAAWDRLSDLSTETTRLHQELEKSNIEKQWLARVVADLIASEDYGNRAVMETPGYWLQKATLLHGEKNICMK